MVEPQEKRQITFLPRKVTDNFLQDAEYWIPADITKLSPGFFLQKGLTYAQCIDSKNTGGGVSNPLPDLASATAPSWWPTQSPVPGYSAPPWQGYVLVDIKPKDQFSIWLVFGSNVEASSTLAPSVEYWKQEDWLWPAVLNGKGLLPLDIFAITNSNLVSVVPGWYLQPETRAKGWVRIREWVTTTPWDKTTLRLRPDVYAAAREIRVGYPGQTRTIRCLHDTITTPAYATGDIKQITYPATLPKTWARDYRNEFEEINGRFFRRELMYEPSFNPLDKKSIPYASGT